MLFCFVVLLVIPVSSIKIHHFLMLGWGDFLLRIVYGKNCKNRDLIIGFSPGGITIVVIAAFYRAPP